MPNISERTGNKADELALQFFGKDYYELDQPDKDRVMDLAIMAVDIEIARQIKVDIEKVAGTGIAYIDKYGGE